MMILQIDSSARDTSSATRRLTKEITARLALAGPHTDIVQRDLAAEPLPHVDEAFVRAMFRDADARTTQDEFTLARSETLIAEIECADVLVLGVPMYNYGVPSTFKAWLDHVVRARRTFRHTSSGPVGLLADRPVWIATASGGVYSEGDGAAQDFLLPYLRAVLGKIGLYRIAWVAAEGSALSTGQDAAFSAAVAQLDRLLPRSAHRGS